MATGIAPPFGDIWDGLKAGNVIPFLGAGASLAGRTSGTWTDTSPFPPSSRELAHLLAERSSFPSQDQIDLDDLAKVSSYTADISGRGRLRERLRTVLNRRYQRSSLHTFLASIPAHLLIVVTNYDTLLEEAFRDAGKPFDLVVYPAERPSIGNSLLWWRHGATQPEAVERDLDLENTSIIYKMHGRTTYVTTSAVVRF
jgi:SIR2-like domain